MDLSDSILHLAQAMSVRGGVLYVVGGSVRDHVMNRQAGDLDVEVHGLDADTVAGILEEFGAAREVGRSFGVFKVRLAGREVDVALPQSVPGGMGRPPVSDPHMGLEAAAARRDLTINAMAYEILGRQVCDLHGGLVDIEARMLREVSADSFLDDPLRPLRVVRFAALLEFDIAPSLQDLCRKGASLAGVPFERIRGELERILLESSRPGRALFWIGALDLGPAVFPGLPALWSPAAEAALDRAVSMRETLGDEGERLALMLAILLAPVSAEAAGHWMEWLHWNRVRGRSVRRQVVSMVLRLPELRAGTTDARMRALADGIPLPIALLASASLEPERAIDLDRAQSLGISSGPLPHLVNGRDLNRAGISPGENLGRALEWVRARQCDGLLSSREEALAALREAGWIPGEA